MTKKSYVKLAVICRKYGLNDLDSFFLDELIDILQEDNCKFNKDKFVNAIKGDLK